MTKETRLEKKSKINANNRIKKITKMLCLDTLLPILDGNPVLAEHRCNFFLWHPVENGILISQRSAAWQAKAQRTMTTEWNANLQTVVRVTVHVSVKSWF